MDPGQPPGAVGREQSAGECHLSAQAGEEVAPGVTGLGRGRRPVGDTDSAPGHEGGRQEGTCVRQVRLDHDLPPARTPGVDPPCALAVTGPEGGLLDGDAPLAQRRHRHGHVRQRGHRPGGGELQAAGQECSQEQECGDELGGGRAIDRHPGALGSQEGAVAGADAEGQEAGRTEVGDVRAQGGQRVEQRRHGAAPGGLVPVEDDRGVGQRGQSGHEAHDGPGQADVDASEAVGSGLHVQRQGSRRDAQVRAGLVEVLEAGAEHAQGGEHELGVARAQEPGERRRRIGDGGQQQGPCAQRLRPRQLHDGLQRPRRHRRPPRLGRSCRGSRKGRRDARAGGIGHARASMTALRVVDGRMAASVRAASGR